MTQRSILVTGSSGMIGTALSERLLDSGYEVVGVDVRENRWSNRVSGVTRMVDLREEVSAADLPTDVDLVVHLAANARVHRLVQEPHRARDNFDMTFSVLEFARNNDVDVIFGSSREVYGNNGKMIHSEEDTYVDECESPYTASKVGGESMLKAYEQCYDIDTTILRFSNVYGRFDLSDRVIPLFIAKAHSGQDLTVFGDDKVLDFTYLDDCVDGIYRTVTNFNKARGTTFNIASGVGTSLVELAEEIRNRLDADIDIDVEPSRAGEVTRYIADIDKANRVLGYDPAYSFEDGLAKTIDWYTSEEAYLNAIL